jgi:hypothetical protein
MNKQAVGRMVYLLQTGIPPVLIPANQLVCVRASNPAFTSKKSAPIPPAARVVLLSPLQKAGADIPKIGQDAGPLRVPFDEI